MVENNKKKEPRNVNKKPMSAKMRHRANILNYLGNPENTWIGWAQINDDVLSFKDCKRVYKIFRAEERREIEFEALNLRRKNSAVSLAKADEALAKRSADGDPTAIKLLYQKIEGWAPKTAVDHKVDEETLKMFLNLLPEHTRNQILRRAEKLIANSD